MISDLADLLNEKMTAAEMRELVGRLSGGKELADSLPETADSKRACSNCSPCSPR